MKKIILALLVFNAFVAMAEEPDSSKVQKEKKELTAEQTAKKVRINNAFNKFSRDRFAIDLLGTNWIHDGANGFKTKWYSRGINVYFYWDFRIKQSRFSVAPGIGYSASNVYSRHAMKEDSSSVTYFEALSNPDDYKVNKVTLQYFDIPLEFRIKTNPDKLDNVWKFAIGFKAGIRVDAHTKTKIKDTNGTKVYVERRFPDFNLFHAGPTLRIGYSSFNITAYYGVIGVFKKDLGPKANAFSLGLSFNGL